jgi:hypothetical protein
VSECSISLNTWEGDEPRPGFYLKTVSGRSAYEILAFKPRRPGSKTYGTLRCRRVPPNEIPEGATVFWLEWASRRRKRR